MATSAEYIEFVCEQLSGAWDVRYKKMFGEYMVYVNDKPIFLVCDNTVFVKKVDELKELMAQAACDAPYAGAKEHYILDIEDADLVANVTSVLERVTPIPKKKAKKN